LNKKVSQTPFCTKIADYLTKAQVCDATNAQKRFICRAQKK